MPNTENADTSDELSQDIRNAIALIKAHPEAKTIAGELKGSPLYQVVFTAGHSEASRSAGKKMGVEVKDLTERAERAEAALAEASANKPDLQARDAAWQKKVDAESAKAKTASERADKQQRDIVASRVSVALAGKLRPKYANLLAPTLVSRIRTLDDGREELLGEGDIPVQIPQGKTLYDVVAEQAVKDADPEDVLATVDRGAGVRTNGAGGGAGRAKVADIRKELMESGNYGI